MNVGGSALPNRFGLFAVFIACLPSTVQAQEQPRTVSGTVVDSANQPISGVLVFVDEETHRDTTGAVGAFRLEGLPSGTYRLNFRKEGFAPRTFRLSLAQSDGDRRDIGVISLEAGPDPTTTLTGRVLEGGSGKPIDRAVVLLNGNAVAVSEDDGRFRVSGVPIVWGSNQVLVGGLSYADEITELWIADPNETFELSVTLRPLPIELAGIVVEGDRTLLSFNRRMQPFYERRERGFGRFFTRLEIEERNPIEFTDLMRGVPGVLLTQVGLSSWHIEFSRAGQGFKRCASPLIYLDGIFVGGANRYVDLNSLVHPDQLEGIEIYKGLAQVPARFGRSGNACGVIVIWTR